MKLDTFDVIELKDKTKAIVIETSNSKYKVKKLEIIEEVILVDKEDIKKVIFKKAE